MGHTEPVYSSFDGENVIRACFWWESVPQSDGRREFKISTGELEISNFILTSQTQFLGDYIICHNCVCVCVVVVGGAGVVSQPMT